MEPTDAASPGALRSRTMLLEAEVKGKEENLLKAAMYGKMLLEENTDLKTRIDNLMKQHATVLEEKQQELCSLNSRLEIAACTAKWHQEEIANHRTELQNVRDLMEEEKRQEIAAHKKQVCSLQLEVDHLQSVEQSLRGQVGDLEDLLQSHLDRTTLQSTSASFTCEELAALSEELSNLKMDLTEAQAKNIDVSGQLQECQREKDTVMSRLKATGVEIEDLQCETVSYSKHLEESRKEILELRAQVEATKVDSQIHSSKGNSIFSELEDRRLVLEKKMVSLKIQTDQLVEKYNIEKQQNSQYKMQITLALEMTNQREDGTAQQLRAQLNEAHAEIRTLIENLKQLEASKDVSVSGAAANGGDQFFMATLQLEREKAAKAQGDLQAKTLQYLDVSRCNMELSRRNSQLEAQTARLRADRLKLIAQKEELLFKYEPDKMKQGKIQEKIVENIDIGDPFLQTATFPASSSGRHSDMFKPCPASGRASNVFKSSRPPSSVSKLPASTGRPSNAFNFKPTGERGSEALKPLNSLKKAGHVSEHSKDSKHDVSQTALPGPQKENCGQDSVHSSLVLPAGRCVRMADDVKVIYADGEDSVTELAEEKSSPRKSLRTQKDPRPTHNVPYIKADEAPEVNCKTQ
ncbi:hypothetical protein ACOMHN_044868 [Nucella lapillus]